MQRSIKVVLGALTNAIVEVNGGTIVDYTTEEEVKKPKFEKKENKKEFKKEFKKEETKEVKKETKKEEPKEVKEVSKKEETKIDLDILTVSELRELAKKKEIKGYSKMKKEELIANLK